MDALKSGAIFRLKNMAVVRSPPVIPSGKGLDHSVAKAVPKDDGDIVTNRVPDEAAVIKRRFDEIYRSTPTPAAMLKRSYYWDQVNILPGNAIPALDAPSSTNSMSYSGMDYSANRPMSSRNHQYDQIHSEYSAPSGPLDMSPPLFPLTSKPSQLRSESPTTTVLELLIDESEKAETDGFRTADTPTAIMALSDTVTTDDINYNETTTGSIFDDKYMLITEDAINNGMESSKSCSVSSNSGNNSRLKSRGRLAGPNVLMNLTSTKSILLSSSALSPLGETMVEIVKNPLSSSTENTSKSSAALKSTGPGLKVKSSPKASLSFMSNMSQTKRHQSPSGKLLARTSASSHNEGSGASSVSKKGFVDRQRFGSLTLIPMSSLLSGSALSDYSSDDSSKSSSDNDSDISRKRGSKIILKSSVESNMSSSHMESNGTSTIGRLRKMSDVLAVSSRIADATNLSSGSEELFDDFANPTNSASSSSSSSSRRLPTSQPSSSSSPSSYTKNCTVFNKINRAEKSLPSGINDTKESTTENGFYSKSSVSKKSSRPMRDRLDVPILDIKLIEMEEADVNDKSMETIQLSIDNGKDLLGDENILSSIAGGLHIRSLDTENTSTLPTDIDESESVPVAGQIDTVGITTGTEASNLRFERSVSRSKLKGKVEERGEKNIMEDEIITRGYEMRKRARINPECPDKNFSMNSTSAPIVDPPSSSLSRLNSEVNDASEWLAEEVRICC